MKYHALNAYFTTTSEAIGAADTTIPLPSGVADALDSEIVGAEAEVIAFTLTDEGDPETVEIVYVTGSNAESAVVLRGRENTSASSWPAGTRMEARATAGLLNDDSLKFDPFDPLPDSGTLNVVYGGAKGSGSSVSNLTQWEDYAAWTAAIVNAFNDPGNGPIIPTNNEGDKKLIGSVVMGLYMNGVGGEDIVCIGNVRSDVGKESVFIGANSGNGIRESDGFVPEGITVVGANSASGSGKSTLVGWGLYQPNRSADSCTTVVGAGCYQWDSARTTMVGAYARADCDGGIVIGGTYSADTRTECDGDHSIVIGGGAVIGSQGHEAIALGRRAVTNRPGMMRVAATPYMPAASESGTFIAPAVCRQTTSQVAMATPVIDLTDAGATVEFSLPSGVRLFPDEIDVVIVGSSGATNAATVNVGTDSSNTDTLVAAGALDSASLASRTVFTPLSKDGVTSVYVSLSATNSGTTSTAKIVVRGYVMEL